jgi:hypothetical protein
VGAVSLTAEWMAWVAALAAPLHDRLAWRLADIVLGILLASGRRTAASWWRAAGVGERFRALLQSEWVENRGSSPNCTFQNRTFVGGSSPLSCRCHRRSAPTFRRSEVLNFQQLPAYSPVPSAPIVTCVPSRERARKYPVGQARGPTGRKIPPLGLGPARWT